MIFPRHTPLTAAGISDKQRLLLQSLWIDSIEEAVAVSCAVGAEEEVLEKTGLKLLSSSSNVLQAIPPERLPEIRTARQGGGLGCLVDEQVLEDFHRIGRLRPMRATPSGAFEAKLPNAVRLMDRMPPVRNQGQRGTCVAFGSVALREFLLEINDDLSEQFLYWACKELDGHPGPGTYIHTAMSALAQYGVCRQILWPYNPRQLSEEGQGPPPQPATVDARSHQLESARTVEPNLVIHYKNVLAGSGDVDGMPVTFGTLVFDSWYKSAETHRTGKITLPLPGESPSGGHAWCIVGYVDDENVPGGGYFIIRNSWGTSWAPDSPEATGHALMPYKYIERYAFEAFTGPSVVTQPTQASVSSEWREYIRVLERDGRDTDGKLLKTGTPVIFHPTQPGVFKEDNSTNRQEFLRLDRSWTDEGRQRAWFPLSSKLPEDVLTAAENCLFAKNAFLDAIDDNIACAKGQPIPEVKSLPAWYTLLAWEPKIKEVVEVADLTDQLVAGMINRSNVPEQVCWPDEWRRWLTSLNELKVYSLSGMSTTVYVVVGFISCFRFQANGHPESIPPGQDVIDLIRHVYSRRIRSDSNARATFTFFTFGSASCWRDQIVGRAASDHWLVVSDVRADRTWNTRTPPRFADRLSLHNFMDRLRPETRQQRISKVKSFVDELLDTGYEGNIDLKKIKKATGYRGTPVRDALQVLRDRGRGKYRLYKTPDGIIAVGGVKSQDKGKTVATASLDSSWLTRLACLGPAVSVSIWFAKDILLGRPFEVLGFIVLLPLAYGGEWLNSHLMKWRKDKE